RLRGSGLKAGACVIDLLMGKSDEASRRVDTGHGCGGAVLEDRLRQRSGPATDVKPALRRRQGQPCHELARDQPTPPPDIALVVVAERPLVLRDLLDWNRLLS